MTSGIVKRRRHDELHGVQVVFPSVASMSCLRTDQIFCIACSVYMFLYKQSLKSPGVFAVCNSVGMCWSGVCEGHGTDLPRTGISVHGWVRELDGLPSMRHWTV